jgi:urea ABC transporter permease protein UrtC
MRNHVVFGLGGLAVVAALSLALDAYWASLLAVALVYGILAMSLDLLWGYAGVLNLAPAVSFGVGAYAWAIVTDHIHGAAGTYGALAAALAVPAAVAALVAYAAFRAGARDIYFSLITLALTLVFEQVAQGWTEVTGGSNGMLGIAYPELLPGSAIMLPESYLLLTIAAAAIVLVVFARLVSGPFGTVLMAIRESEARAETLGFSTLRHRVAVSAISAAAGGLAGALYAPLTGIVEPSVFAVALSIQVFVWVAVGGQSTLLGPLVGAIAITIGQAELSGQAGAWYLLIIGVVFVLVVIVLPGGLASLPRRLRRRRPAADRRGGAAPKLAEGR